MAFSLAVLRPRGGVSSASGTGAGVSAIGLLAGSDNFISVFLAYLAVAASFTWLLGLPFLAAWATAGTLHFDADPKATAAPVAVEAPLPAPRGPGAEECIVLWEALSYAWIGAHLALGSAIWVLRFKSATARLRQLEDPEMIERWGSISTSDCGVLDGLTPSEICTLPSKLAAEPGECPICLCPIKVGEGIRTVCGASHTFHRPCIDLWLVRRADCPLCKSPVRQKDWDASVP